MLASQDEDVMYITEEGRTKAEAELHHLKDTKRVQVAQKIGLAKEMGDLSENAEYAAAKEEQGFVEARITELEHLLKFAIIVPNGNKNTDGTVTIGTTVTIGDEQRQEKTYTVVGINEADPTGGKITNESPLGKALVGQKVGDSVVVPTPSGKRTYLILNVS